MRCIIFSSTAEFAPVRKRGEIVEGVGIFNEVRGSLEEFRVKREEMRKMKREVMERRIADK